MRRFALALALAACSGNAAPSTAVYDAKALPPGALGASIAYGREIVMHTHRAMPAFVRADMSCTDCHLAGGTVAKGGSFAGTYARFPQWNKRAHRVIALQDRIAECFLYSMNGKPPAYSSKAMIAIVAYIAWLSRGTPTGAEEPKDARYIVPLPSASPDVDGGSKIYASDCSACHRSDGSGISGVYPPLWGSRSFASGAGMSHIDRMTGFVRYNMPANAPGSLTLEQSYDVAAFVLGHPRPGFRRNALVKTPALPARYF